MTFAEALAVLTTPAVYDRIHHLLDQASGQHDVDAFRTAMLAGVPDNPGIHEALQTFWQHYASVPLETVIPIPLPDTPDSSLSS